MGDDGSGEKVVATMKQLVMMVVVVLIRWNNINIIYIALHFISIHFLRSFLLTDDGVYVAAAKK